MSKSDIILLDTETTGLTRAMGNIIENQPYIIELFCLRTTKKGRVLDEWHSLFKPPIPVPEFITKINGWCDEDLVDAPVFADKFKSMKKFFKGTQTMVAHNLPFDKAMMEFEIIRALKDGKFNFPPELFCTAEQSLYLKGFRLRLKELHEMATGLPEIANAHKADADVYAMRKSWLWLKKQKRK